MGNHAEPEHYLGSFLVKVNLLSYALVTCCILTKIPTTNDGVITLVDATKICGNGDNVFALRAQVDDQAADC